MERDEHRAPALVVFGVRQLEPSRDPGHLGLRGGHVDPGLQPRDHDAVVIVADRGLLGGPRNGRPQLGPVWDAERRRHDADHGKRLAVQRNLAAHDGGVGAKTARPQPLGEDDHVVVPGRVFVGSEGPAQQWLDAERLKEPRRDAGGPERLGLATASDIERAELHQPHPLERAGLALPVQEVRRRYGKTRHARESVGRRRVPDEREAIGVGEREGAQQDGVHHAEDRGVGSDAQRQHDDGRHGIPGPLAQHAHRVAKIAKQALQGGQATAVTTLLARPLQAADFQHGLSPRFRGAQSTPQAIVDVQLEVAFELGVEFAVAPPAREGASESNDPGTQASHGPLPLPTSHIGNQ